MRVKEFAPWHLTVIGSPRFAVSPELASCSTHALMSGPAVTIATDDEIILASVGGLLVKKRTADLWAIVSPVSRNHPLALARGVNWCFAEMIRRHSVRRFQCVTPEDDWEAQKWARSFGLKPESPLPGFGDNGETYIRFARVLNHERA